MEQFKIMQTGDWELTKDRIKIVEPVVKAMLEFFLDPANDYDLFAFCGDLFAEGGFCPETVRFVNKWIPRFVSRKASRSGAGTFEVYPIALLGNHDWLIGEDKISALFSSWGVVRVITGPKVLRMSRPWSEDPWTPTIGILPAPDRAELGAHTGPQGPRERDAEISRILEAALIDLEAEVGEDLERSLLLFHATVNSTRFNGSKLSSGLTWTVDAERLRGWGAAVGGHIHAPSAISTDNGTHIVYTGTIAPDRHGMKAQTFRFISTTMYPGDPPSLTSTQLPRAVIPIEISITPEGVLANDGRCATHLADGRLYYLLDPTPAFGIMDFLVDAGIYLRSDLVDLKIRLQLPRFQLDAFPTDTLLIDQLNEIAERELIYKLQVKREETNTDKIRLDHLDENTALDLEELVQEWAKASELEDHKALPLALGLLKGAEFSEWRSEGHKGIVPIRTVVKNFRQWDDVTIDWTKLHGAVAVIGDNATGKTNLAEAPLFAWYKRTPSSSGGLSYELRTGEKSGFIEHVWEVDEKIYLVRRALERSAGGEVACKSELFEIMYEDRVKLLEATGETVKAVATGDYAAASKHYEKALRPVCEKAVDIDKKIVEINGASYDFMISTIYGTQSQVDNLVNATPTTWHKRIIESLSLDRFEDFRVVCTRIRSEIETALSVVTYRIEELDEQIATKTGELADLDAEALEVALAEAQGELALIEITKKAKEAEKEKVVSEKATVHAKLIELVKVAEQLEAQDKKIKQIEKQREEAADIGERPDVPVGAEAKIATGEAMLKDRREIAKGEDDEIDKEQKTVTVFRASCLKKKIELEVLDADYKNRAKRIDGLKIKGVSTPDPPCVEWADTIGLVRNECPAWAAFSESDALAQAEKDNADLRVKLDLGTKELGELDQLTADAAGILKGMEDARTAMATTARKVEVKTGELKNLLKAAELWDAKNEGRRDREINYTELLVEKMKLEKELEGRDSYEKTEENLIEQRDSLTDSIRLLADDSTKTRAKIRETEATIAKAKAIEELIEGNAKKIAGYKAEIGDRGATAEAWGLLEQAFHHTGLPFLLLERMVPVLESTANELLSDTDLAIHFHTQREVGEGKDRHLKDEIYVEYTDPRGTFPLKASSGAQSKKLGLTARFTLAKVGAEFWGRAPMIFIQDEGWGAFHSTRIPEAMSLIRKVADVYETFLFITHVDQLAEGADQVLTVALLADGSSSLTY